ncbi:MAG: hypothetical protein NT069_06360 [Planctomycetota bacterium]|nr:hypothetical protein [Planctomycetota bacterium]
MPTHVINLRGPWNLTQIPEVDLRPPTAPSVTSKSRLDLPHRADGSQHSGGSPLLMRYQRHFNRPTNLESADRVAVVVESAGDLRAMSIDLHQLVSVTTPAGTEADITHAIAGRHLLTLDFHGDCELISVRLEIRSLDSDTK